MGKQMLCFDSILFAVFSGRWLYALPLRRQSFMGFRILPALQPYLGFNLSAVACFSGLLVRLWQFAT